MLSIIISSYQPHYFSALEKNIAETIGVPYELIKIDNPGLMGICEAYNKGAKQAKNPFLLFVHEDVEFTTHHWGENLIKHLKKPNTGVVGLAGSVYVPNVPFAWWDNLSDRRIHLKQYQDEEFLEEFRLSQTENCYALDGVFLACRTDVWKQIKFSKKIKGFHAYDVDFSVRVSYFYQNIVVTDIALKHFSLGKPDTQWWRDMLKVRKHFKKPPNQKIDKKKELRYYVFLNSNMLKFYPEKRKLVLLKYCKPQYIGYKAALKNFVELLAK
ncbi:hypothetical protein CO230_10810 [Chryseobacterium sp. 6424]|uniref:glycosyltransferase n=1 Tax=Chryseobacterium sp. 6424 TaxID=2039166 RepID=UPI000EFA4E4A|nr:glycosyltransferase [Chryseobacterium sp. 6424]AYO58560.1 hypothetical protein CO230_10810 [Chryseobacterium sp. 6424]